jgi:sporulation protein YlmC with PRC-barrel domain
MFWNATSLNGLTIAATDGPIGTVSDLLFNDETWTARWLIVATGSWFSSRKILLPVSVLGKPDEDTRRFTVHLTRQQVRDSPEVDTELPVSRHKEAHVYHHYGWNPYWTSGFAPMGYPVATSLVSPISRNDAGPRFQEGDTDAVQDDGDPHLRSMHAIIGYHIAATDGEIGHVEDFLIDDTTWRLSLMTVDTKNLLPGQRVLLPVRIIRDIDWFTRVMTVAADRAQIKSSPPYDPQMTSDGPFNEHSHQYFGLTLLDGDELRKLKIGARIAR